MDDMPKQHRSASVARESLERIARSLDRSLSSFFDARGEMTREAETLALVTAFERIADSQARARCLAFVTAEADRTPPD